MKFLKSSAALLLVCALLLICVPAVSAADTPAMTLSVGSVTRVDEDTVNVQINFDTGDQYFLGGSFTLSWDPSQVDLIVPLNAKGQDDAYQLVGSNVNKMAVGGSSGGAGSYTVSFTSFSGTDVTNGTLFNLTFTLTDPDITVLPLSVAAGNDIQVESIDGVSAYVGDVTNPLAAADNTAINIPDYIPYIKYGDVDGSGNIDTVDARLILQYIVGKITAFPCDDKRAADVSGNGKIDTVDARMVLQYIVNKITSLGTILKPIADDPVGDGSFTLSVGLVTRVDEDNVNVAINYDTADQYFINGTFILNWDSTKMSLVISHNNDITPLMGADVSRMTCDGSYNSDGVYTIAFTSSEGILNRKGALLNLTFTLLDPDITVLPLSITIGSDVSVEDVTGYNDTLVAHVTNPLAEADNTVIGVPPYVPAVGYGDVNKDGIIDTTDARLVLQHIVGKISLEHDEIQAADVSGNGKIDTVDARMILQYIVGKIAYFGTTLKPVTDDPVGNGSFTLSVGTVTRVDENTVNVAINYDTGDQHFINGTFVLNWDPALVNLMIPPVNAHGQIDLSPLIGTDVNRLSCDGAPTADGAYMFVFAAWSGVDNASGTLFHLTFTLLDPDIDVLPLSVETGSDISVEDVYGDNAAIAGTVTNLLPEGNQNIAIPPYAPLVSYTLGDVNADGKIDTTDARLILQSIVKKVDLSKLNATAALAADVNGDGKIDTVDARLVLQYIVGKLNYL